MEYKVARCTSHIQNIDLATKKLKKCNLPNECIPWLRSSLCLRPQWDRCCRGEAEVRLLNFKTTWSEFQKASQTATQQGNAESEFHHLPRVGPKQLCASAHLGCTRAAGTS